MSIGMRTVQYINRVEAQAEKLGLKFAVSRFHRDLDTIALVPLEDEFPLYSRDAELFVGTLAECECFLNGLQRARDYDKMLKVSDEKKRQRKEQDYRNEVLVRILKRDRANEPTER